MKYIIYFAALLLLSTGYAQRTVEGVVKTYVDKKSAVELLGAEVFFLGSRQGAVSDEKGGFVIEGVKLPDTLIVRASGHYSDTIPLSRKDIGRKLEITLFPSFVKEEVVILAKRDNSNVLKLDPRFVESLNSGELRKAACCNLSESFETNATVDVSLADGVSGSKRIQMMGLSGRYTQMQFENIPFLHNLDQAFGLGTVPGTWIESIQITKGAGTVVNGYESMNGLINIEYQKPDQMDPLFVNAYANLQGRYDVNLQGGYQINDKWSTGWFLHYDSQLLENDRNRDGFRDMPLGDHFIAMNRWKYKGELFRAQIGAKVAYGDRSGGQVGFDRNAQDQQLYGAAVKSLTGEVFGKTGLLFKNNQFSSIGVVYYAKYAELNAIFGNRTLLSDEQRGYVNLLYENILGNTNNKLKLGASFVYDQLTQEMNDFLPTDTSLRRLDRTELVPGIFSEYTYDGVLSTFVLGMRADYHNLFGFQFTPRANYKYSLTEDMDLRLTAGRGFRVSNYAVDNLSLMATNTPWIVQNDILPEISWNFGASYYYEFELFDRGFNWSVDFYHTFFENQLVADRDEDVTYIVMKNLSGQSFSNALQTDIKVEITPRLEMKAAYKFLDVRMTTGGRLEEQLMVPKHRGFYNISYTSRNKRWEYDATISVFGARRLAVVQLPDGSVSSDNKADVVPLLSGQVTHNFKKFEVYLGGENLLDYRLSNPIVNVENPFDQTFDATRVYAPIFGINVYAGIRMALGKKEK